ncbi:hypothetical protein Tco_0955101 [Tanacetum coccineum]|uniref:Uncharacterized protein n=1 Tax=Tanacetum coccineum TaxID=301880 RepID=A0ABQ5E6A0_9ASTR
MPHESPPHSVHSLGRDEGSLSLNELTDLCTSLSKKVEGLESELKQIKQTYSTALIKLILRVKKLKRIVKITKARRRARIVVSEDEDAPEDSSKQGRKISDIDEDPNISLVQDEGMIWFQNADVEIKEKNSADTEIILEEELKAYLDLFPREEFAMEIESLATKYPIVDWKTYVLAENFMYYQIFRADGSSKNYKIFSEMLDDFDRQDVLDLHRLVKARYMTSSLEGYDLMLWGDLKTLFEPDEEDKV